MAHVTDSDWRRPSPLSTARSRNSNDERRSAFFNGLLDSLRAIPGVQDAVWGMFMPLGGGGWGDAFLRVGSADAPPDLPSMQVKMGHQPTRARCAFHSSLDGCSIETIAPARAMSHS